MKEDVTPKMFRIKARLFDTFTLRRILSTHLNIPEDEVEERRMLTLVAPQRNKPEDVEIEAKGECRFPICGMIFNDVQQSISRFELELKDMPSEQT